MTRVDAIVCLNGATGRPETWDSLAAALSGGGTPVVPLRLLGHRGAARPGSYPLGAFVADLLTRLDDAGLRRIQLIGHSLGAVVASRIAIRRPTMIDRLVLEEPVASPRSPGDRSPYRPLTAAALRAGAPFTALTGNDPRMLPQVVDQLVAPQPGWWSGLSTVDVPTLIIGGGPGSMLVQSRLRLIADAMPDAQLVEIGGGHRVHSARPQEFNAAVAEFGIG